MSDYSVVDWHSGHDGYRCGYCKSSDSNYSHGMTAYRLTVDDYQDLIDRGWRRSGSYVYKPTMNKTCCPQYTIRCDAPEFCLSRSQKKAIKRVNKYLNFGTTPDMDKHDKEVHHPSASDHPWRSADASSTDLKSASEAGDHSKVNETLSVEDVGRVAVVTAGQQTLLSGADLVRHQPKPGVGVDPTKPKCMKAKLKRLEKKNLKIEAMAANKAAVQNDSLKKVTKVTEKKTLEDYLGDIVETPVHKLEIRLVRSSPASEEFKEMYNESYNVFKKYQTMIHGEDESECSTFMYKGFLVDSPLNLEAKGLPQGFGSFHQLYILDGKIIAVGVLDILPRCISSVYFYYDPDYSFISLGTYSALRELALTRELHRLNQDLTYYYMGFYIHTCPKMRYKGQYDPSYLLCPEAYSWHQIENCEKKLDEQRYNRFAEPDVEDKDSDVKVDEILVLHQRQPVLYGVYKSKKPRSNDKKSVSLYARLVGKTLAKRILLIRQ